MFNSVNKSTTTKDKSRFKETHKVFVTSIDFTVLKMYYSTLEDIKQME